MMGLPPKGEIVARPMVTRSCGHQQEFQEYKVDKYRAQRLAKFQQSRCPACVEKLNEAQRLMAPIPKSEALKQLPAETEISLRSRSDGTWTGTLNANGKTVSTTGAVGTTPQTVVVTLARLWLATHQSKDKPAAP